MSSLSAPEPVEIGGFRTAVRRSVGDGIPTLFVHGNPSCSYDWLPFAERLAGPAIALDLPGFGEVGAPGARALRRLDGRARGVDRRRDRRARARTLQARRPRLGCDRPTAGRRALRSRRAARRDQRRAAGWPATAGTGSRACGGTPRVGELLNRTTTKVSFRAILRARAPAPAVDALRLARRDLVPPSTRRRGTRCSRSIARPIRGRSRRRERGSGSSARPLLVVWGGAGPLHRHGVGQGLRPALPDSRLEAVERAGHWPWIDRPELVERHRRLPRLDRLKDSIAPGADSG